MMIDMILRPEDIFKNQIRGRFQTFGQGKFFKLATILFNEKETRYQLISAKGANKILQTFKRFYVDKRILKRRGKPIRNESYLFLECEETRFRVCRWSNEIIPSDFKFEKSKYKNYHFFGMVPKDYISVTYSNENNKSIFIFPRIIRLDEKFARGLGIFGSDGTKSGSLGIKNTDEFIVEELKILFKKLNVTEEKLTITKFNNSRWKDTFLLSFENKVFHAFIIQLHKIFLEIICKQFNKYKNLACNYIQGFHAGDGCCYKRSITISSSIDDFALEKIKIIIDKLGLNLTYESIDNNGKSLTFCGLYTFVQFYKNLVWHPFKKKKLEDNLRSRFVSVLLDQNIRSRLVNLDSQGILKLSDRSYDRYTQNNYFIPLENILAICEMKGINPISVSKNVKQIKSSREFYSDKKAQEIFTIISKLRCVNNG